MHAPDNVTPRQKPVLDALRRFIRKHDRSPSVREIGRMVGINSTTAFAHLQAMKRRGVVVGGHEAWSYRPADIGPQPCHYCATARAEAVRACIEIARLHGAESACREMGLMLEAANDRENTEAPE